MSNTFCVLPWIHAQTKPDGQIKPCCRFDHSHKDYILSDKTNKFDKFNINNVTFNDALNSQEWQEIRNSMLAGEQVAGCRKCYQEEYGSGVPQPKNIKRNHKSMRVKENWMWNEDNQNNIIDKNNIRIRYLELAFGNHCNLKCRTCNGILSTTWYDDDNKLAKYYADRKFHKEVVNVESEWNVNDFIHVEEIKFTGGEPMLHPDFIKTIDMIISTGRQHLITLDIFTNASWIPREKILSRLMQFKQVTINLSVDGLGYVNDYIRFPSEWTTVNDSVREWLVAETKDTERLCVKWAPVISVMNVWSFHKMLEWWFLLQKEIGGKEWWDVLVRSHGLALTTMIINTVSDPAYLKPSLFPKKFLLNQKLNAHRDSLIQEMNNYEHEIAAGVKWNAELTLFGFYSKVLSALNEDLDMEQLKIFVEYTADLDKLRGQDIRIDLHHLWKRIEGMIEYKGRINE
jgi:hypothetical protein